MFVKDCGNSVRVLLKHYAALHTPEKISDEYWANTPATVKAYMKTRAWDEIKRLAGDLRRKEARGKA